MKGSIVIQFQLSTLMLTRSILLILETFQVRKGVLLVLQMEGMVTLVTILIVEGIEGGEVETMTIGAMAEIVGSSKTFPGIHLTVIRIEMETVNIPTVEEVTVKILIEEEVGVHLGVQMTMGMDTETLIGRVIAVIGAETVGEEMMTIIEGVEMTTEEILPPLEARMITIHPVILIMTVKRATEAVLGIELEIAAKMAKISPN